MCASVVDREKNDDLESIDWLNEGVKEQNLEKHLNNLYESGSFSQKVKLLIENKSKWIIIMFIGVFTGMSESFLRVGLAFFSDFREGICVVNALLSQQDCCWNSDSFIEENNHPSCAEWKKWSKVFSIQDENSAYFIDYLFYTSISCLYTVTASFIVHQLAPFAQGSGIAEIKTILGGYVMHGFLGIITFVVKLVTLVPTVASGLMVGQEGPMVHIGCSVANLACRIFRRFNQNEASKRELIATGAASGVAVAFRSPIGGLLFAMEEVSSFYSNHTLWISFVCALIGVLIINFLNNGIGYLALFYINLTETWKGYEILCFILLGILGGLYGVIFTKFAIWRNFTISKTVISKYPILETLFFTLLTSLVCFPGSLTRKSLHTLVSHAFQYQPTPLNHEDSSTVNQIYPDIKSFGALIAIKSMLMIFTYGLKVPTGIFLPSMVIGSYVGCFIQLLVDGFMRINRDSPMVTYLCQKSLQTCTTNHIYAIVGAAAFLTGTTHITAAVVVIMFELTGVTSSAFPVLVSVMVAKWISSGMLTDGLYETTIKWMNYPFLNNKEDAKVLTKAADVLMEKRLNGNFNIYSNEIITQNITPSGVLFIPLQTNTIFLKNILENTDFKGFPVAEKLNEKEFRFLGFVHRGDLVSALAFVRRREESIDLTSNLINPELSNFTVTFSYSDEDEDTSGNCHLNFNYILDKNLITANVSSPTEIICSIFKKLGVSRVVITNKGDHLLGIITKSDIIHHIRLNDIDHPGTVAHEAESILSI